MENCSVELGGVALPLIAGKDAEESIRASWKEVDKLDNASFIKVAGVLGLTVDPFKRATLRSAVLGAIQLEWHKAFGTQPSATYDPAAQLRNQERRIQRTNMDIEDTKAAGKMDLVSSIGVRSKAVSKPRVAGKYILTDAGKKAEFTGQKFVIQQTMLDLPPSTIKEIFAAQKPFPGIKAPSDKNCQFYMNAFVKEGFVELSGQAELPATEEPKTPKAPKAPKAPTSKKK